MKLLLRTWLILAGIICAQAYGSSTTLAPMWSEFNETAPNYDRYSICVLQAGSLVPLCDGTIKEVNSSFYGIPPANVSFSALSAGGHFTCGLVFGSQVPVCWGDLDAQVPQELQTVSYVDIASGGQHACALQASGLAECWGSNVYGQADAPRDMRFTALSCGDRFSCGLVQETNKAFCWGYVTTNFYGLQMPNQTEFVQIAAGAFHVCGIQKLTYRVVCWGSNKYEQSNPPDDLKFSSISVGSDHSCGLIQDNHQIACWGGNAKVPAELSSSAFTTLVSGDYYTCVVGLEMALKCWGYARSATERFNAVKVAPAPCRRRCGGGQYRLTEQLCPTKDYQVCIDKIREQAHGTAHRVKVAILVVIPLCAVMVITASVATLRRRRHAAERNFQDKDVDFLDSLESELTRAESFTKHQLQLATSNYSSSFTLGTGSYGVVYKGALPNGNMVAIKRAKSEQRLKSFGGELRLLARLHHTNLVNLIGYCKQDCSLVFEYMANGSLYDCMFKKGAKLEWPTRLKIAAQAARGLEYLHIYAVPSIIHRDVKSSNILLDEEYNAHVSDFGLSMLGPLGNLSHVTNTTLVGTPGYLDPEYFQTMQLSSKSDVYSFGIVLLELFTGRKAVDVSDSANVGIVSWVSGFSNQDNPLWRALDASVPPGGAFEALLEALELALSCTALSGKVRPTMSSVASSLEKLLHVARQAGPSTSTDFSERRPFSVVSTSWESSFSQSDSLSLGPR